MAAASVKIIVSGWNNYPQKVIHYGARVVEKMSYRTTVAID